MCSILVDLLLQISCVLCQLHLSTIIPFSFNIYIDRVYFLLRFLVLDFYQDLDNIKVQTVLAMLFLSPDLLLYPCRYNP